MIEQQKNKPLTSAPSSFCLSLSHPSSSSLEQRNEELQVEVVRLKTNLAQQRHWYQAIQAKIVESERARAAAELRNATLQREMEQYFDTFGELNSEVKKTEHIVKSFWRRVCLVCKDMNVW